jgi:NTE family protein
MSQLEDGGIGPSPQPGRLFVAFEGGGAKALVHVGALKALEERGFEFKGVSGTSAGAIIAALKAVGYTADEIADPM